ncbi:FHA domain-containing protein [Schaalia suimastitidis]|uniref:FHA domain-containing protein n=1 Tax=Schaalia suimastitidis TaxID=121163 RepID=UPI0004149530|nr:FHA domain-containing protein [Schaalia suimastitidis]
MLHISQYMTRGAGSVAVYGVSGVALVPVFVAASAQQVLNGREDVVGWLQHHRALGTPLAFLDTSHPVAYLSVFGGATVQLVPASGAPVQVRDHLWGEPIDPALYDCIMMRIGDPSLAAWMPVIQSGTHANEVCIGTPTGNTAPLMNTSTVAGPTPTTQPIADQGVPGAESLSPIESAVVAPTAWSSVDFAPPTGHPVAFTPPSSPAPGPAQPSSFAPPTGVFHEAVELPVPAPQLWVPDDVAPNPVLPQMEVEPPASNQTATSTSEPLANPEALEATITPQALENAWNSMQHQIDVEATVMRRPEALPVAQSSAFLIYAGSAPVEVLRDVVIGRAPDTHKLPGRMEAIALKVPSPDNEISRSHCAVLALDPGAWSLMDLGSVNGTLLRRAQGVLEEVAPMNTVTLADGDVIDLGEGVSIEFRIRWT